MWNKYNFNNLEDLSSDKNIQDPNFVISDAGGVKNKSRFFNIAKLVVMGTVSTSLIFFIVKAAPPLNKYSPGETLAPTCSPGDPNCTITTPAVSGSNSDITSLSGLTTALSAGQGGTGLSTIAANKLLYSSALNTFASLSLDSTLGISSGILSVQDNSITGAKIALGSDTTGDIMYYNGTDWARLGVGTSGQYLKTQGYGTNPAWATLDNIPGNAIANNALDWSKFNDAMTLDATTAIDMAAGDLNFGSGILYVDNAGRVGVGTTGPTSSLHVEGQCVTGDTELRRRRKKKKGEKADPKKGEWEDEEYIYDKVMIKNIQPGDEIASMYSITGELVYSQVNGLMNMGVKEIYQLTTQSGRQIRTTENHPYFVRVKYESQEEKQSQKLYRFEVDQSIKIEEFNKDTVVAIANKESSFAVVVPKNVKQALRDTLRKNQPQKFNAVVFASAIVKAIDKIDATVHELTIDTEYVGYEKIITDVIVSAFPAINISFKGVGKKSPSHYAAYYVYKNKKSADYVADIDDIAFNAENALRRSFLSHSQGGKSLDAPQASLITNSVDYNKNFVNSGQWVKVKGLRVGQMIAVVYGDNVVWEKIIKIKQQSPERVYDIEVEGTHNFVANDIIAHNTYLHSVATDANVKGLEIAQSGAVSGTGYGLYVAKTGGATTNVGGYFSASGAATNNYGLIVENGNVGIGTTAPGYKLDVAGTARVAAGALDTGGLVFGANASIYSDSSNIIRFRNAVDTGYSAIDSAAATIRGNLNVTTGGIDVTSGNLTLSAGLITQTGAGNNSFAGNVGIGTTATQDELGIYVNQNDSTQVETRNTYVGNKSSTGFMARSDTASGWFGISSSAYNGGAEYGNLLSHFANRMQLGSYTGATGFDLVASMANSDIRFYTGGVLTTNERMRIMSNGNVGIGTTAPSQTLDVAGSATISGNVGIGTTAPAQKLHVEGQCVTGDTLLKVQSSKHALSLPNGLKVQSGEEEFEDVQIKDIKGGEYVLSLNEKTGRLEPAKINGFLDMGVKPIYKLTTESGKTIRTTGNHPYLSKQQKSVLQETANRNNQLFASVSQNSRQSQQNNSQANNGQKKIKSHHSNFDLNFNKWRLNSQKNTVEISPAAAKITSDLSKIAGKATEASAASAISEQISESLFSWSFDNFNIQNNYSKNENNLSNLELAVEECNIIKETPIQGVSFESLATRSLCSIGLPPLSYYNYIFNKNICQGEVKFDNKKTLVDPAGFAPATVGGNPTVLLHKTTGPQPWLDSLYQEDIKIANWTKVIYLSEGDKIAVMGEKDVVFERITKIEQLPPEQVYDIEIEGTHNFVANGIIAHNTYINSVATDADVKGLQIAQSGAVSGTGYGLYVAKTGGAATNVGGYFSASGATTNNYGLIVENGNVGIGAVAPTAKLHLAAGTATANTAPLKFTSGTLNTTAEAGAIEFLTDAYYGTITTGAARKTFAFLESPSFTTPALGAATYATLSGGNITNSALTAGRLTFAGTAGILSDDSDLTFSTDTLSATKLLSSTSVSTPSLISAGAMTITPLAGQNLNVALSTTGDFAVNTSQLYVDTSSGYVGIGTTAPAYIFDVNSSASDYLARIYNTSSNAAAGGLYVRSDGTGNLLNLNYNGVDKFTVSPSQITSSIPISITSPGDTEIAYDLLFSNPTAANIKSSGPLYITAGDAGSAVDLSLSANNGGYVVVDDTFQINTTSADTTAGTLYGSYLTLNDTGVVTSGTDTTYGAYIGATRAGATNGTFNTYGLYSSVVGDTAGTSTAVGGYFSATGADNNYGLIVENGNVGIGAVAPTAKLHLAAGTATANTAPLKFTSGTLNTTAEAGAIEFLTDAYYGTITTGAARKTFAFLESPSFTTPTLGVASATSINKVAFTAPATGSTLTIADGKTLTASDSATIATNALTLGGGEVLTFSASNALSLLTTGTTSITFPTSGTLYGTATDSITSAQLLASLSNETGTGALVFGTAPTFTTSLTSPLVIGGVDTTSDLFLKTTFGIGAAGADMHFLVGNNGATEAMTILNSGYVGIGITAPAGNLAVSQTVAATGALKGIVYTGAVNTNQTLSTEIPSLTLTTAGREWATGALTTQREVLITQPTYSFVGASTITDAATIGIAGAPIKSTNATITNTHGLLIQAGAVSTAANSYGLTVNAQTGATYNYAAALLGGNVGIGTASPLRRLDIAGGTRMTGTSTSVLTGTIDPAASTTVAGVGTAFTTELIVGDRITVTGETRTVTAIASDTSLIVDTAFSDNANDTSPDKLWAIFSARDSSNNTQVAINDLGELKLNSNIYTGGMEFGQDNGVVTAFDMPVSASAADGTAEGYNFAVDGTNIVTVYSESNGAGIVDTARVGIGTTAPANTLDINGTVKVGDLTTAGGASAVLSIGGVLTTVSSSQRFKENITDYESVLSNIEKLKPVHFNWKADTATPGMADFGLIAEDVVQVLPELVTYEQDGQQIRGVKYDKIPILLLKAVQELDAKIGNGAQPQAPIDNSSILDKITEAIGNFGITIKDGITHIAELIVNKITTKELCIDDVCINKNQLKELLEKNNIAPAAAPVVEEPVVEEPAAEESAVEEPVVEEPIVEEPTE